MGALSLTSIHMSSTNTEIPAMILMTRMTVVIMPTSNLGSFLSCGENIHHQGGANASTV
jgi:hypothetical protein